MSESKNLVNTLRKQVTSLEKAMERAEKRMRLNRKEIVDLRNLISELENSK